MNKIAEQLRSLVKNSSNESDLENVVNEYNSIYGRDDYSLSGMKMRDIDPKLIEAIAKYFGIK